MKVGDGAAGPEEPLQLLRVWLMGSMPVGTKRCFLGYVLACVCVCGGGCFASPSPGCMPISWERISDPNIKEVSAPGREVRAGWGWGSKIPSVGVGRGVRVAGTPSKMQPAWRGSERGWGRY